MRHFVAMMIERREKRVLELEAIAFGLETEIRKTPPRRWVRRRELLAELKQRREWIATLLKEIEKARLS